jgi:hypothetical protein
MEEGEIEETLWDDDHDDRLIEERRKRRAQILQKHDQTLKRRSPSPKKSVHLEPVAPSPPKMNHFVDSEDGLDDMFASPSKTMQVHVQSAAHVNDS